MHVGIRGWLVTLPVLGISLENQTGQDHVLDVRGESGGALLRYDYYSVTVVIFRLRIWLNQNIAVDQ